MAIKKFQVVIGTEENPAEKGGKINHYEEVECEHFTMEQSGAITFWRTLIAGQSQALVVAYAPGQWQKIIYISQVD